MIGEQIIKRTKLQPTQKNKRKRGYLKAFFTIRWEKAFFCFQAGRQKQILSVPLLLKKWVYSS